MGGVGFRESGFDALAGDATVAVVGLRDGSAVPSPTELGDAGCMGARMRMSEIVKATMSMALLFANIPRVFTLLI